LSAHFKFSLFPLLNSHRSFHLVVEPEHVYNPPDHNIHPAQNYLIYKWIALEVDTNSEKE
jgi:hypothetical protein